MSRPEALIRSWNAERRRPSLDSEDSERPLHVLVLCHEWPPVGGGAGAVAASLSDALVDRGYRCTVVTMALRDTHPADMRGGSLRVIAIPCGRRDRSMASPFEGLRWAAAAYRAVRRVHTRDAFDVCHAHFAMPAGIVAERLKRSLALPYLITPHGSDVPGFNPERMGMVHRVVAPWWRRICAAADQIVSPSWWLAAQLERAAPGVRCTVIPNGIDPSRFVPGTKSRSILLCSRLVARKGFQHVLEVLMRTALPGWRVDIVGDGPYREHLQRLAKKSRVPTHMHGWLDQGDARLRGLYASASLFVLPSQRENFSVALLEAMSAGCAVVTTDVSGNPEAVGSCAVLVPWADHAALERTLVQLTTDEERCHRLGACARERVVGALSWASIAKDYDQVLRALVGSRRAGRA